ncbi:hypothetical protein Mgra_00006675 [Meloidogyne graminicola]|uniref:Uncharacterized protein n=1 Tax=Meloidogyne graminicola TaxID=189291 RepID=A0A8S9ZKM2_9BILA|nr:hypothetical protein Mgra_00006675 [Meloidogyne graminicola]
MQKQNCNEADDQNNQSIPTFCVRRPRIHRRQQSLRRINYKKSAAARSDDMPGVPNTEEVFKNEDKNKEVPKSFVDPYVDSETGILPQQQPSCKKDSSHSSSQASSNATIKAVKTSAKQKRSKSVPSSPPIVVSTTTIFSPAFPPREELFEGILQQKRDKKKNRSASPKVGKYNKIRRQLKVAILKRNEGQQQQQNSKKATSKESTGSSTEADDEDDDDDEDEKSPYSSISSMSTVENAGDNDDSFDCCVQLWNILVKIVKLVFEAGNYVLDHKLLFYPLALIFLYLCLGVLHSIFASILASFAGWFWPPLHFILSTTAGFVWRLADWLSWVDELGRSLICDMAASYCRRYRLLCDRQCSFVDRAVEHSHGYSILNLYLYYFVLFK